MTQDEAKDEPVAWMHIMDNTEGIKANGKGIISITQKRKHPFGKAGVDFSKSYPITSTPLYTTPPQRKPLTDEELLRLLSKIDECTVRLPRGLREFARAIEAAHGIKGEA